MLKSEYWLETLMNHLCVYFLCWHLLYQTIWTYFTQYYLIKCWYVIQYMVYFILYLLVNFWCYTRWLTKHTLFHFYCKFVLSQLHIFQIDQAMPRSVHEITQRIIAFLKKNTHPKMKPIALGCIYYISGNILEISFRTSVSWSTLSAIFDKFNNFSWETWPNGLCNFTSVFLLSHLFMLLSTKKLSSQLGL